MKMKFLLVAVILFTSQVLKANPLLLQRAGNYLPSGSIEVGLEDIIYRTDLTKFTGTTLEITNTVISVPLFARYAITDEIEAELKVPYIVSTAETTVGGTSTSLEVSGIGNSSLAVKYSMPVNDILLGISLIAGIPTGGDDFQQGIDIFPLALARKEFSDFAVNVNVGYKIRGEFTESGTDLKIAPANILKAGAGLEYLLDENITLGGEILFEGLGESEINDIVQKTSGTRLAGVIGVRYDIPGGIKTKFGFALSLGDETYRNYDYKVFIGLTYKM